MSILVPLSGAAISDLGKMKPGVIELPGLHMESFSSSKKKSQCCQNPDLECDPAKMPKGFCAGCADWAR
jgi:hypothetical protein